MQRSLARWLALTWSCSLDLEKHDVSKGDRYLWNGKCNNERECVSFYIVHSIKEQCGTVAGINHDPVNRDVQIEVVNMNFVGVHTPCNEHVIIIPYNEHLIREVGKIVVHEEFILKHWMCFLPQKRYFLQEEALSSETSMTTSVSLKMETYMARSPTKNSHTDSFPTLWTFTSSIGETKDKERNRPRRIIKRDLERGLIQSLRITKFESSFGESRNVCSV